MARGLGGVKQDRPDKDNLPPPTDSGGRIYPARRRS